MTQIHNFYAPQKTKWTISPQTSLLVSALYLYIISLCQHCNHKFGDWKCSELKGKGHKHSVKFWLEQMFWDSLTFSFFKFGSSHYLATNEVPHIALNWNNVHEESSTISINFTVCHFLFLFLRWLSCILRKDYQQSASVNKLYFSLASVSIHKNQIRSPSCTLSIHSTEDCAVLVVFLLTVIYSTAKATFQRCSGETEADGSIVLWLICLNGTRSRERAPRTLDKQ